jgi:Urease accessory protein UreH
MQSCRVPMTFLLALLSGVTVAHDGIMHHPETHSELTHFAAHLWMAVPVAVGAALLVWGQNVTSPNALTRLNVIETACTQGWQAELRLGFVQHSTKTVLANRSQRGPLAVQRPFYPEGDVCHAYILHPPGGVVGGDCLQMRFQVDPAAHALLTTPGATKFYRSAGLQAQQHQHFHVADG